MELVDNFNLWTIGITFLLIVIAYLIGRLQSRTSTEIPTDLIDLYKDFRTTK